jgi:hypothetical protein
MVQCANRFSSYSSLGGAFALSILVCTAGCASTAPASSAAAVPSSETARGATSAGDSHARGGASLFVVHLMSDFEAFKKYFEEGTAARTKAGIKGHLLTRLDDGRAVVHLFADDAAKVEEELKSPAMERYLDRKGAPESSLVWFTNNELVKLPATPPDGPTFSLYLKLRVTDFDALAAGFTQDSSVCAEHGVIGEGLHRSTNKEELAVLHFVGTSRDKLEALTKRPEFAQLLSRAGSKEEAKPLVGVDVSRSRPELPANSQ